MDKQSAGTAAGKGGSVQDSEHSSNRYKLLSEHGGEWSRFLLLMAIMVAVVLLVGGQAIHLYYDDLLEREQKRLYVLARSQAQMIQRMHKEDIVRLWMPQLADERIQKFITEVLPIWQSRLGETGEIVFARRQGEYIQFLFSRRHAADLLLESVPWREEQWAEPMRRALQGQGGSMIGNDYRGVEVIAAYEYLPDLQMGMVAKVDLSELNAPIGQTAQGVLGTALLSIVLGVWIFSRISEGVIGHLRRARDELAQSEQALRESEQTYRSLFANMLNGFLYCQVIFVEGKAVDLLCLAVNEAFSKQTGLADVVGRRVTEFLPGFAQKDGEALQHCGRVAATGVAERFEIYLHSIQQWFDASLYSPHPGHFVAVFDVISARKLAEQKISEESNRRNYLFEHSRDGLCILGMDGRIQEANAQFARMLGYEREEMNRLYVWDWDVQWGKEEILSLMQDLNVEGASFVTHHRRKDGSRYTVEVSTSKMVWQGESLLLSSHRDITRQVQQEAQLRQAVKMEAIGTLAGGIAHDFNNILSIMLGFAELAMKQLPKEGQPCQDVQEIFQAGLRARDLVSQLLAFSRRAEQQIRPISIDPLLKEVVKFLRAVIPEEVQLHLQLPGDPVRVLADPAQIHEIIMNLATNALQAMEGAPGRLRITLYETELPEASAYRLRLAVGRYGVLTVADSGPGIAPEHLPRIFDPFFTTKEPGRGTGLGLSVVHGLVTANGGAVEVNSRLGEGAQFCIYLPLAASEEADAIVESPL
ncbi:PAS domain-containing sensor histidine kinase [Candidatus Magnetaquicoccus inordinatus]|uniref:PAS domain-containing sensor histidine kinase n=1 Tax=Candidatus Magnetaquicoccus inordinatus TaxID=2496818 RepID=UPI00102AA27F|nr:ATP-binding protein [Candidatus Magnetaquicoccus inordinatus]